MCASVDLNGKFDVEVISFVLVSKSHQNCEKKKSKKIRSYWIAVVREVSSQTYKIYSKG